MKVVSICLLLTLVGCATSPLVRLDVDERLLDSCPKTLPILPSGDDTAGLEWSKTMLSLYAKCANMNTSLSAVIKSYNEKVDKATKQLDMGR